MANRSSNKTAVPEAKGALDKFKYEVASELGVPLSDGYNGDLTSRQNGSVGGYMVKKMIEEQEKQMSGRQGQSVKVSQAFLPDTKKGMSDKQALPFSLITKLEIGLEPTTPSLRVKCSTN